MLYYIGGMCHVKYQAHKRNKAYVYDTDDCTLESIYICDIIESGLAVDTVCIVDEVYLKCLCSYATKDICVGNDYGILRGNVNVGYDIYLSRGEYFGITVFQDGTIKVCGRSQSFSYGYGSISRLQTSILLVQDKLVYYCAGEMLVINLPVGGGMPFPFGKAKKLLMLV